MKKICCHWTAGTYELSKADFTHYHYTVDQHGVIHNGLFPPEANNPPLKTAQYAAHCGGGNSYCIGVALRGMHGYKSPKDVGPFPLTQKQCEAAWQFVAGLCRGYGIDVSPKTVFTHYEFGKANPNTSSKGKIDITYLPHEPTIPPDRIGAYIRNKVKWYLGKS
jgi:hypothetical protein